MNLKRCDSGHLFDPSKHSLCPFCGVPNLNLGETRGKRIPPPEQQELGPTRPRGHQHAAKADEEKTRGVLNKKLGMDPVLGWLVCVKGPERGRDYRIRRERNFIGRSEKMDICIAGDKSISREKHAVISYNPKKNTFSFAPGETHSMVYVNGEDVGIATELKPYDRIEMGESELLFVPFCGEKFQWA